MPTSDPTRALDPAAIRVIVEGETRGRPGTGLGVEVELFPLTCRSGLRRVPIHGPEGTLARLADRPELCAGLDPGQRMHASGWCSGGDNGVRTTFEPGGQLEVSSRYQSGPHAALAAAQQATAALADALAPGGVQLAAAGIDLWAPGTSAQQLTAPRYPAMDRYLAARGPVGRTMMRDTCALQLNLDLADGEEARARWRVANLLAPVATATFATSPSPDARVRSRRSLVWQRLDPTRTGFPTCLLDERASLADQLEQLAMDADVLVVDRQDGRATAGRPGWRFGDWVARGHPRHGWPTADDLASHLTTLFPEVRPRGFLEIRSIDALPARWRRVAAVLYAGAVYDPRARDRILEVLTAQAEPLTDQLRRAAGAGLTDPARCAGAVEVWSFALQGAARLPAGSLASDDLARTERFLDRFTLRGRAPADELVALLATDGPTAALDWAAEPGTGDAGDAGEDRALGSRPPARREGRW